MAGLLETCDAALTRVWVDGAGLMDRGVGAVCDVLLAEALNPEDRAYGFVDADPPAAEAKVLPEGGVYLLASTEERVGFDAVAELIAYGFAEVPSACALACGCW